MLIIITNIYFHIYIHSGDYGHTYDTGQHLFARTMYECEDCDGEVLLKNIKQ